MGEEHMFDFLSSEVLAVWAAIASALMIFFTILGVKYQRRSVALQETVTQLKMFDEPTAISYLQCARFIDHEVSDLIYTMKKAFNDTNRSTNEQIKVNNDLLSRVGQIRGRAKDNLTNLLRVYRLSGTDLDSSLIDQWIKDGFMPEHYRKILLAHVSK